MLWKMWKGNGESYQTQFLQDIMDILWEMWNLITGTIWSSLKACLGQAQFLPVILAYWITLWFTVKTDQVWMKNIPYAVMRVLSLRFKYWLQSFWPDDLEKFLSQSICKVGRITVLILWKSLWGLKKINTCKAFRREPGMEQWPQLLSVKTNQLRSRIICSKQLPWIYSEPKHIPPRLVQVPFIVFLYWQRHTDPHIPL